LGHGVNVTAQKLNVNHKNPKVRGLAQESL
jgi:hypothetical protein